MSERVLTNSYGSILPISFVSITLIFLFFIYTVDVDRKSTLEDVRKEAAHIAEITELRLETELEAVHAVLQDVERLMLTSPANLQQSLWEYEKRVEIIKKIGIYFIADGSQSYTNVLPGKTITEQPFFKLTENEPFYWQPRVYTFDSPEMAGRYLVMSQYVDEGWYRQVIVIYIDVELLSQRLTRFEQGACTVSLIFDNNGNNVFQIDTPACDIKSAEMRLPKSTIGRYWYSEVSDDASGDDSVYSIQENNKWAFGVLTIEDTSIAMGPWRDRTEIRLLVSALFFIVVAWLLRKIYLFQSELLSIAMHDGLTGLGNRQYLDAKIPKLQKNAESSDSAFSVILLDLDHFKKINDRYGHEIGDEVLISCSEVLRRNVRDSDYVFRVGGEEFLILLPETDEKNAKNVAERIREAMPASHPKGTTASCGIATRHKGEDVLSLTKRADMALYFSKETGRNLTTTYSPSLCTWEI